MTEAYMAWKHREIKIRVKNPASVDGFQQRVEIALLHDMNEDGSDIRFCDIYGTALFYWIESKSNNIFTVWIKLPAYHTYIYFFYGNKTAKSESNGKYVFEFFEDFADTLDTTLWNTYGDYAISDSKITIQGSATEYAWVATKETFGYNTICDIKMYHPTDNISIAGYFSLTDNNLAVWEGAGADSSLEDWVLNTNASGTSAYNEGVNRTRNILHIYSVVLLSTGVEYFADYVFRRVVNTNIPTAPMSIIIASEGNHEPVKADWIRVRKYTGTAPILTVVYDLVALDPVSVDVTRSIDSSHIQLSATFADNLVPPEKSKIRYAVSGVDATDYLEFVGNIVSNSPTIGQKGNRTTITAADDMISFSEQKVPWTLRTYVFTTVQDWLYNATLNTNVYIGNFANPSLPEKVFSFDPNKSKWDATKEILEYAGCLVRPRFDAETDAEFIDVIQPENIDITAGFKLPSAIEFISPGGTLVDEPEITRHQDENINHVLVFGEFPSLGTSAACRATTYEVFEGTETAKEIVIQDNYIEQKDTTLEIQAVKWLLYYAANRATVKAKFVNRVGLELYQRVRFGPGFAEELQNLTSVGDFSTVYTVDPAFSPNLQPLDVSGVPKPSWLRISSKKYHASRNKSYTEYEFVTDFIYSSVDPAIPAPYNTYLNPGLLKPVISDTIGTTKSLIKDAMDKIIYPETAVVLTYTDFTASVNTSSGKALTVKTFTAVAPAQGLLVVPDGKGNYIGLTQ
jgi:hypothetical protein